MRIIGIAAVLLGLAVAGSTNGRCNEPVPVASVGEPTGKPIDPSLTPYAAVRSLQSLQDQVAHGSAAAQAAQPRMLAHVAEVFAAADPGSWKDMRNAGAAALYLFSAGRPSVVRAVIERSTLTPEGQRLVNGALAYSEGQDDVARALLGTFEPRSLSPSLGGHLALVLATLFADKDPKKSERMLDAARLLVPGTLVEEAALRRQIFALADAASLDKFTALSRQYIRRFRTSVFASNFKGRLTSFAARIATSGDVAQLAKLDMIFAELPVAERREIYLTLARNALVEGRPDSTRYAAGRAADLSPDAGEALRARLYTAAAGVASDDAPAARRALLTIDAGRLSARDADLRDAALAVAAAVEAELGDRSQDPGLGAGLQDDAVVALLDRAHRAMTAGDALLGGKQ